MKKLQVDVVLDEKYQGPTLAEIAPAMDCIEAQVIDLRWNNTKDEIRMIHQYQRKFRLRITDPLVWANTLATFGKRLQVPLPMLERTKTVLAEIKGYDWRKFLEQIPSTSPRYLLLQLVADAIRKGKQPKLTPIVVSVFVDGISSLDADVLLRLKSHDRS